MKVELGVVKANTIDAFGSWSALPPNDKELNTRKMLAE